MEHVFENLWGRAMSGLPHFFITTGAQEADIQWHHHQAVEQTRTIGGPNIPEPPRIFCRVAGDPVWRLDSTVDENADSGNGQNGRTYQLRRDWAMFVDAATRSKMGSAASEEIHFHQSKLTSCGPIPGFAELKIDGKSFELIAHEELYASIPASVRPPCRTA